MAVLEVQGGEPAPGDAERGVDVEAAVGFGVGEEAPVRAEAEEHAGTDDLGRLGVAPCCVGEVELDEGDSAIAWVAEDRRGRTMEDASLAPIRRSASTVSPSASTTACRPWSKAITSTAWASQRIVSSGTEDTASVVEPRDRSWAGCRRVIPAQGAGVVADAGGLFVANRNPTARGIVTARRQT